MTECKQEIFEFQGHFGRKITADFSGGYLSSDGGAVFVRGMDQKLGLIGRLAGCFEDRRFQPLVEHSVEELLRQRIGALALGYEDLNDHDRLRLDPMHALMAGKQDIEGATDCARRTKARPWQATRPSTGWSWARSAAMLVTRRSSAARSRSKRS